MKGLLEKNETFAREFQRFQKNFGIVVCQLRKNRRLSRSELARQAKFSRTTLDHIERGKGNPSLGRMENLAAALAAPLATSLR